MRLKRIEIRGFKTFADNTEMDFTPGITAVVGPNGSGKSNISDAIAWVMGESNVRNLRATRTEDVIFNGSAKRKPVGLAEVSLTLDNSSGRLPIGFQEVTVTRRAYRSGDSEYLINKTPCRLRDIYELFLDSGAGRGAYSMVSQGEIDRLLTGKAEDRRELLEEAAGVKKYRVRRHETYRKLEHTQDNLSRVEDIMQELQAQMEPLSEQAEKAIRYRELVDRLKEIEVGLLVSRVQKLNDDISAWREQDRELRGDIEEVGRLVELETESEQKASIQARQAQEKLEQAHAKFSDAQAKAERLRSDLAIAEARRQSADEARRRLAEEIVHLETRLAELMGSRGSSGDELAEARQGREQAEAALAGLRSRIESLQQEISGRESELASHEAGLRGLVEDKAAQKSRLETGTVRIGQLEAELGPLQERIASLAARREARAKEAEQASLEAEKLQDSLTAGLKDLEAARSEHSQLLEQAGAAAAEHERLTRLLMEQTSRLKALKQMHDAGEGMFAGVRAVLAASRKGQLPSGYAIVADILEVPSHLDQAVEAALGSALQDIAADSFEMVRTAIEFLKNGSLGRATFLPLDRLDRPEVLSGDRLRAARGILGCAYDLVQFPEVYEPVARLLLGRVVVAENLEKAAEAARTLRGWSKIVTPDGELLLPGGAITGGSRQKKGPGLTERRREIADLTEEVARSEKKRAAAESASRQRAEQVESAASRISAFQTACEDIKLRLAGVVAARDAAANALPELEENEQEAERRLASARQQIADLQTETSALRSLLSNSDAAGGELESLLQGHRDRLSELRAQRADLANEMQDASSRHSALVERERALARAREALETDISRTEQSLDGRRRELAEVEETGADDGSSVDDLAASAEQAFTEFEERRVALMACQSKAQERANERDEAAERVRSTAARRESLSDELHGIEVSLAKAETEITQSLDRLWEDYEITKNDALTWPDPLLIKHGTVTEVARLRREIRAMGDVNTGAVAEFERVRERWEFLAGQRADLEEARESLLQAIREIDESTRELFMSTYNLVAEYFADIFVRLFGGGMARLELTTPENLLETGIEVIVQPPGKNLQKMDLLSGGEKALTAQALLFALMRARPSPFCVLDEVDAPLDDANVVRFADLVKEYAQESQFIVITHNRATMEAADVLYGVTMREPGISSLYGARISDL